MLQVRLAQLQDRQAGLAQRVLQERQAQLLGLQAQRVRLVQRVQLQVRLAPQALPVLQALSQALQAGLAQPVLRVLLVR